MPSSTGYFEIQRAADDLFTKAEDCEMWGELRAARGDREGAARFYAEAESHWNKAADLLSQFRKGE